MIILTSDLIEKINDVIKTDFDNFFKYIDKYQEEKMIFEKFLESSKAIKIIH